MEQGSGTRPPRMWPAAVLLVAAMFAALPSEPGPPSPPPPAPSRFTLDNGMEVCLRPIPDAERATLLLLFKSGSRVDPPRTSDGVHLLEHLFLYLGSQTRAPRSRDRDTAGSAWEGLRLTGYTAPDHMVLRWTCPPERLEAEMAEVALRLQGLRFDAATWFQEREAVSAQIREPMDPEDLRWAAARGGSTDGPRRASGVSGREERFARLTLHDVRRLEEVVFRPDRTILAVAGRFQPGPTRARIRATFGTLARPSIPWSPSPLVGSASRTYGLHRAALPREEFGWPRLRVSFAAPAPGDPAFPAILAAAHRIATAAKPTSWNPSWRHPWTMSWLNPMEGGEIVVELAARTDIPLEATWTEVQAELAGLLREPPDAAALLQARRYGETVLGTSSSFAARSVKRLETAALHDAMSAWKNLDRERVLQAVERVSAADYARSLPQWLAPARASGLLLTPPPPTEWVDLPNGIRLGVHPLPEAERTSVAFLLPFGRENGPSPVVARLFAHGLTPGWGVSPWSVRSGRDHTVLWWAGAPRSLEWVLRDLAARLSGMTPSEEDLAREKERAADPDPFPEPGLPAGVSTALLEGFRAVAGLPRTECPAPVDAADAAAEVSDWFSVGGARVVVAGPFRLNSTTVDSTTSLLVQCLAPLPARTGTPPRLIPRPLPDFPGSGPGAKGRSCRAFAIPPTAPTPEFAACLLVGLRHGVPFRAPLSGNRLPPVVFDPLMDPGVLVFATPPGRGSEDPPWRLPLIDGEPSPAERRLLKDLLGGRLGAGREPALDHPSRTVPSPAAAAVRAALLDFRGIDGKAVRDAIDAVTPEVYAEAVRRLKEATPAEFRLEVE